MGLAAVAGDQVLDAGWSEILARQFAELVFR